MKTLVVDPRDAEGMAYAADLIRKGEIVAFPTETVYGLGADASNPDAIKKIFAAKGRPQDNPLIVHTHSPAEFEKYAYTGESRFFEKIREAFMPGPITVILKKKDIISSEATAGLDSVGLRCPSNPAASEFIRLASRPIAAPSANISGKPSPTCLEHIMEDMEGRIPCVIDGGECTIGVESTVVSLLASEVRILRPGGVTPEQLAAVCGAENVITDENVTKKLAADAKPLSPGMKYRHYAPRASVTAVRGENEKVREFFKRKLAEGCGVLCFDEDCGFLPESDLVVSMGSASDPARQAHRLFGALRRFDFLPAEKIYARCPDDKGVGLAVYNRLLRACAFEIIDL